MRNIFIIATVGIGLLLFASAAVSGLSYQLDGDELYNTQFSWLLLKGNIPYKDFFMLYTPVFHWFIAPIITWGGEQFSTLYALRWLMVCLFVLRIFLIFLVTRDLFSRWSAQIVIPILLLDPLFTFSGMQIRPDNLMLTVSLLGMYCFVRKRYFWSGFFLSAGVLVLLKAVPYTAIFCIFGFWYIFYKKLRKDIMSFIVGLFAPLVFLFLYTTLAGLSLDMIRAVVVDTARWATSVRYPTPPLFFYQPNNIYFFGVSGTPLTWLYLWILPFLAVLGFYRIVRERVHMLRVGLVVMAITQWALFFLSPVVFVQYYLSFHWLLAILAAAGLDQMNYRLAGALTVIFLVFAFSAINGNLARTKMTSREIEDRYQTLWRLIPANEAVFSYVLFRPVGYPVSFLGDNASELLSRFPTVRQSLEEKKVNYLLMNEYHLQYMKALDRTYVRTHFEPTGTLDVWTRKL